MLGVPTLKRKNSQQRRFDKTYLYLHAPRPHLCAAARAGRVHVQLRHASVLGRPLREPEHLPRRAFRPLVVPRTSRFWGHSRGCGFASWVLARWIFATVASSSGVCERRSLKARRPLALSAVLYAPPPLFSKGRATRRLAGSFSLFEQCVSCVLSPEKQKNQGFFQQRSGLGVQVAGWYLKPMA